MPSRTSAYLEQMIHFLMPYFLAAAADVDAARSEIIETLASYGARARSELLNAAQILAFGMSTLDTLAEAKATEMSPTMRLRFRGCANSLSRSGQQNDKSLATRLGCDQPEAVNLIHELADDVPDAQIQETIQQARATIDTRRNRLAAAPAVASPPSSPPSSSQKESNKRLWGAAMAQVLADMGMSPGTASTA